MEDFFKYKHSHHLTKRPKHGGNLNFFVFCFYPTQRTLGHPPPHHSSPLPSAMINQGLCKHQEVGFTLVTKVTKFNVAFRDLLIATKRYVSFGSYELLLNNVPPQMKDKVINKTNLSRLESIFL